jgi:hypothetical protein
LFFADVMFLADSLQVIESQLNKKGSKPPKYAR